MSRELPVHCPASPPMRMSVSQVSAPDAEQFSIIESLDQETIVPTSRRVLSCVTTTSALTRLRFFIVASWTVPKRP